MSLEIKTNVGPSYNADGSSAPIRQAKTAELVVQQAHGELYEATSRQRVYIGANPAGTAVTTQVGLSATTPALTLYNPANSGTLLVILTCTINFTASPAAAAGLILAINAPSAAAPTSTTTATIQNAYTSNSNSGIGQCYRIATLAAAPLAIRYIGGTVGASSTGTSQLIDNINGGIIIGPGVALSIQSTSTASIIASFTWEEVTIV